MKHFLTFLMILFCYQIGSTQNIDFDKLNFQGLSPYSPKEIIIEKHGNPGKVYEPNYECGFLSSEEQSKKFSTLDYTNYKFTGNETDDYILDEICFNNESIVLNYEEYQLNWETDIKTLVEIFNVDSFLNLPSDTGVVIIPNKNKIQEDGYGFEIKNGKLTSIHYWSPC